MVNVNRHKPEVIVAHYFIRPPNAQIHKPTRVSVGNDAGKGLLMTV